MGVVWTMGAMDRYNLSVRTNIANLLVVRIQSHRFAKITQFWR